MKRVLNNIRLLQLAVALLLTLASGCASRQSGEMDSSDVDVLFDRITWETSLILSRGERNRVHGVDDNWTTDIWYLPTGPERALTRLGRPAADRLILALTDPIHPKNAATFQRILSQMAPLASGAADGTQKPDLDPETYIRDQRIAALKQPAHPLYTATYLRILSQMRDPAAPAAVVDVLSRERDERVVTECFRVLALLGDVRYTDTLRKEFGRPGVRLKRLLWALAMLGDQPAANDFLNLVESLVQVHPLLPPGGLKNPVPEIPSAGTFAYVLQPDDPTNMTKDLTDDLTEVSLMPDPRAVRILIEGLSSHRRQVLHTSEYLLQGILDVDLNRQPGTHWHQPGALYTLQVYHGMVAWWETVHQRVRWSAAKNKFILMSE